MKPLTPRRTVKHDTEPKREPSFRDSIGLAAASEGDLAGLNIFVRFAERELLALWFLAWPKPVRMRMDNLRAEAKEFSAYLLGFIEGERNITEATLRVMTHHEHQTTTPNELPRRSTRGRVKSKARKRGSQS